MIIVFEGVECCGKTSIAKVLSDLLSCHIYRVWRDTNPKFHNNNLCNKCFEEVVIADFLNKNRLNCDDIIIDRSLPSGIVYHRYNIVNNLPPDETYDDKYWDYWTDRLSSGVNGGLMIVYIIPEHIDICEQKYKEKNKEYSFRNTIETYRSFWLEKQNYFKLWNIKFLAVKADNSNKDEIIDIAQYIFEEMNDD